MICAPARERADDELASAPAFCLVRVFVRLVAPRTTRVRIRRRLRSGFGRAFYFFGENYGFSDLLHGFAGLAALLLDGEVGVFFGGVHVALQDAFGAFQELAGFQALGELGVGRFQARHFDFGADQEAYCGDQSDVALFVDVGADVLEINYANEAAAAEQRHREEGLVGIFGELVEEFEARIFSGVAGYGYGSAMFGDPAGDALADAEFQAVQDFLMWILRGAQD